MMKERGTYKEKKRIAFFSSFGEKGKGVNNLRPRFYQNCDCREGILRRGIGLKKYLDENGKEITLSMENNGAALHTFLVMSRNNMNGKDTPAVYVIGLDGYAYLRNSNGIGGKKVYMGSYVSHCAMRGEDKVLFNFFSGGKGTYVTEDGTTFKNIFTEPLLGGCVCNRRFVALSQGGEVYYTAALAPYDEDDASIDGRGILFAPTDCGLPLNIKEYDGNAYLFFEKGIYKVTLSASARESRVEKIPYYGGTLCGKAQATTKDGIIFLAREGLYYLRKDKVERICDHLPIGECVPSKSSAVGHCDDLVIFSYYKVEGEGTEMKRLVVYADGEDGYFTEAYGPLGGNEYAFVKGTVYRYAKDSEGVVHDKDSTFTSEWLDFGTAKRKRLKTLTLKGEGSMQVTVQCDDRRERKYTLRFQDGVAKARLFDKGKKFSFAFSLASEAIVEGMEVEYLTEG